METEKASTDVRVASKDRPEVEAAIVVSLARHCTSREEAELRGLFTNVHAVSGNVVTGNILLGKIPDLVRLLYVTKVEFPKRLKPLD